MLPEAVMAPDETLPLQVILPQPTLLVDMLL
jgi:hypothetical protein